MTSDGRRMNRRLMKIEDWGGGRERVNRNVKENNVNVGLKSRLWWLMGRCLALASGGLALLRGGGRGEEGGTGAGKGKKETAQYQ